MCIRDRYNAEGADELVFYDITASVEGRKLFTDILEKVASEVFIPLTVGGGISSVGDFKRVLDSGADKVSVNSGAIADPRLIADAAEKYGSQCVVLSLDVKRAGGRYSLFKNGGRVDTGLDALTPYALRELEKGHLHRGPGQVQRETAAGHPYCHLIGFIPLPELEKEETA